MLLPDVAPPGVMGGEDEDPSEREATSRLALGWWDVAGVRELLEELGKGWPPPPTDGAAIHKSSGTGEVAVDTPQDEDRGRGPGGVGEGDREDRCWPDGQRRDSRRIISTTYTRHSYIRLS